MTIATFFGKSLHVDPSTEPALSEAERVSLARDDTHSTSQKKSQPLGAAVIAYLASASNRQGARQRQAPRSYALRESLRKARILDGSRSKYIHAGRARREGTRPRALCVPRA